MQDNLLQIIASYTNYLSFLIFHSQIWLTGCMQTVHIYMKNCQGKCHNYLLLSLHFILYPNI